MAELASSSPFSLEVEGLTETLDGFRGLDKVVDRVISKGLARFAKDLRRRSEKRGSSLGGVHRHAVAGGGIEEFTRAGSAGLRLRSRKEPTILGAEYGAKQYRQFPKWRGNQFTGSRGSNVGYMVHPALRDYLPTADDALADAVLAEIANEIEATK